MRILSWPEIEDPKERQEALEANAVHLSDGVIFWLNHDLKTALMNSNDASREDKLEACKLMVSLGYTPMEEVWNSGH